jgi:hypothetical protein
MFLFGEQQDVTLTSGLGVDRSPMIGGGAPATLPVGSTVDSFLVHADKVGSSSAGVSFTGTYTFNDAVIGLIYSGTRLTSSDSRVGIPGAAGLTYDGSGTNRQLESGTADAVTVSADGHTVTFDFVANTGIDEVRVITGTLGPDCSPAAGNALDTAIPPADLRVSRYESDECMFLFDEQRDLTLSSGLSVDRSPVIGGGAPVTLPAGSTVDSFLLHADKVGSSSAEVLLNGSYTFDSRVIGLIYSGARLTSSDSQVGIPGPGGLTYDPSGGNRQLEGAAPDHIDSVTVSADGRTVTFDLGVNTAIDEVRVITGTVAGTLGSASTLGISLVPDFRQTISGTQCQARGGAASTHGSPLSLTSCNPPGYTPGTVADLGASAVADAALTTVPGDLATVPDEADVSMVLTASDVRARSSGGDYVPNPSGPDVTLVMKLRISDRLNGPSLTETATVVDFNFGVPVNCSPTASGSVGSDCDVMTSADAVVGGSIIEGKDSVFQVFRVRINDAGTNGGTGDADDRTFATQGIYIP